MNQTQEYPKPTIYDVESDPTTDTAEWTDRANNAAASVPTKEQRKAKTKALKAEAKIKAEERRIKNEQRLEEFSARVKNFGVAAKGERYAKRGRRWTVTTGGMTLIVGTSALFGIPALNGVVTGYEHIRDWSTASHTQPAHESDANNG